MPLFSSIDDVVDTVGNLYLMMIIPEPPLAEAPPPPLPVLIAPDVAAVPLLFPAPPPPREPAVLELRYVEAPLPPPPI